MKLFKTIGAACAALAIGSACVPGLALAGPATQQQIDDAISELAAATDAYNTAVNNYNDGAAAYNAAYEWCEMAYWNHWIYDMMQCRFDAEDQWYLYDEPPLNEEVSYWFFQKETAENDYHFIMNCGNYCN